MFLLKQMLIDILFCIKIVHFWNRELHNSFFMDVELHLLRYGPSWKNVFLLLEKQLKGTSLIQTFTFQIGHPICSINPTIFAFTRLLFLFQKIYQKKVKNWINSIDSNRRKERMNAPYLRRKITLISKLYVIHIIT